MRGHGLYIAVGNTSRDSIQLSLPDHGQDMLVQARSKVKHVRRPAIQLVLEPLLLGNIAECRHFRWLKVVAARSLLHGIDLDR